MTKDSNQAARPITAADVDGWIDVLGRGAILFMDAMTDDQLRERFPAHTNVDRAVALTRQAAKELRAFGDITPMPIDVGQTVVQTAALSATEFGALVRLLGYQWHSGGLPDDVDARARIAGMTPEDFAGVWDVLEPMFEPIGTDGRMANGAYLQFAGRHPQQQHAGMTAGDPLPQEATDHIQAAQEAATDAAAAKARIDGLRPEQAAQAVQVTARLYLKLKPTTNAERWLCGAAAVLAATRLSDDWVTESLEAMADVPKRLRKPCVRFRKAARGLAEKAGVDFEDALRGVRLREDFHQAVETFMESLKVPGDQNE